MNTDEQYVPGAEDVRADYAIGGARDTIGDIDYDAIPELEAEFDRFLARVRRDAYDWGRHDERMSLAYAPPESDGGPTRRPEPKETP